jgi:hypothetical protein
VAHVTTAPGLGRRTWSALAVTVLFAILAAFADANDFVRVKRVIDGIRSCSNPANGYG